MSDPIDRQAAIAVADSADYVGLSVEDCKKVTDVVVKGLKQLPSVQPEIIRCHECKHNPKYEWFGCPMSHLSEAQRPETAWCWKAERRTNE